LRKNSRRLTAFGPLVGGGAGSAPGGAGVPSCSLRARIERKSEGDREQVDDDEGDDDDDGRGGDGEGRHSSKNTPCAHGQIQL
jgi:hypothetical protein